jgi:ankyrin repeat protein
MSGTSQFAKFVRAVRDGDRQAVRRLVAAEPGLVRATDPACFGATALIAAVGTDRREMVDLLLELGADVNQRSDWWAGSFGVLDSASDEMASHLLARGAVLTPHAAARLGMVEELRAMLRDDPTVVRSRGGDGQMPLHFARTPEIVDLLLAHGAEIDALDIDHASTAAQWLCGERPEAAAHLVSRGAAADPFLAVRTGDVGLLERLVAVEPEGVDVRVSRERFAAAPPAAGHIYLYTIGEGCTLLHAAATAGQAGAVRWLGMHGTDVNARGGYDHGTALHAAAWADRAEAVAALLDCGAEIDAVSGPMHRNEAVGWAIVSGAVGAVRVLLERGARVRAAHREDARKGVAGAFREFNPKRGMGAWEEILRMTNRT